MRWLLLLACLAGLAYAALAVPFGGRTLWERVQGGAAEGPAGVRPPAPREAEREPAGQAVDQTTEDDRQALDRLIEDRLKAPPGPADAGHP